MSVKVESTEDDGVVLLACYGELDGLQMPEGDGDEKGMKDLLGQGWASERIVLDMSGATYIDSAAVGWLLSLHKGFTKAGGKMVVCALQPTVRRVIELMRIQQVIPIVDDKGQALAKLREG